MGTSQRNQVGQCHFLQGGRVAGGIMRNDTRPCTSGALGETRTSTSCSLSHSQSSCVCQKLLGAGILHTCDQPLSLTGGWWIYPSISTSVFTLHMVLVRTTCECLLSTCFTPGKVCPLGPARGLPSHQLVAALWGTRL